MEASKDQHSVLSQNQHIQSLSSDHPKPMDLNADFDSHIQKLIHHGLSIFVLQEFNSRLAPNLTPSINHKKHKLVSQRILSYNRKAKSLEELSKKFIQHFEGKGKNLIQLEKITVQMEVQRRRIYDVINILESLNVIIKKGKNNYEWKGLCQAVKTINNCIRGGLNYKTSNFKKEKSLQCLAAGFLRLFINWKPAISLEQAAKQMMKQMNDSVKTKIRRLYDIINVFRSLGLVRKTTLPTKKPGYEWAGTNFIEHLIIKKQFNDENTGLNQLNNDEYIQNSESKTSSLLNTKNIVFSPFICPQAPKLNVENFKLASDIKVQIKSKESKSQTQMIKEQLFWGLNMLPIFQKTSSAFKLVVQNDKTFY